MQEEISTQINAKMYKHPEGKPKESVKLIDISTDICSFFKKNRRGNFLVSDAFQFLKSFGKIPTSCPVSH